MTWKIVEIALLACEDSAVGQISNLPLLINETDDVYVRTVSKSVKKVLKRSRREIMI